MLTVSSGFAAAIAAPSRMTRARVHLEISDTKAWLDNTKEASSEATVSRLHQVTNRERQPVAALATWEPNRWRLDGSFVIPPEPEELPDVEIGWWSANLCDPSGLFSPAESINITCGALYNAAGITITFDPAAGEYASDFTVTAFDGADGIIYTESVLDNDRVTYRLERVIPQFQRIELAITRWGKGQRRARVTEIDFGLIEDYGEDGLINLSVIDELDPTSATLPAGELRFKLDNSDRRFNITNPEGLHYFLQRRQRVTADLGVQVGDGVEYVPAGVFYLADWKSDHGTLTASFTARSLLDVLSEGRYRRGKLQTISAYDLAIDILEDAGVIEYEIGPTLHDVPLSGCVPLGSHRDALQLVAVASGATVRTDRRGRLIVDRLTNTGPVASIDFDNAWEAPEITLDKLVTAVEVEVIGYRLRETAEAYAGTIDIDGQVEIWIEYNNPCQTHQVTVTDGLLEHAEHYAYASRLLISGSGPVTITVTADEMEQTKSLYTLQSDDPLASGEQPQTLQVSNPLISTTVVAADVATWLLAEAKRRLQYNLNWRQHPALEVGDIVTIEDDFGSDKPVRITRNEYEFGGYLSGRSRAKGGGSG